MATQSPFPIRTLLAFATAGALLVGYRHLRPGMGISPAIFPQAARVSLRRHPPAPDVPLSAPRPGGELNHVQEPAPGAEPQARQPISPFLIDNSGALDPFFASLRRLELPAPPATPAEVVTVLHYGDSPTTADLITGDIRRLLQEKFGDAGRGYLLTGRPWAWYGHDGVDLSDHGWEISNAVGKGREEVYGLGGASFAGGTDASSHIVVKAHDQTSIAVSYLAQPEGGELAVLADGQQVDRFSTAGATRAPAWKVESLPAGTKTVDLKTMSGSVRLFGDDLRTGHRGILYDSLGLNGASTSVLSNGFNVAAWSAELKHDPPSLIVINYGTNESGYGSYVDKQYEPTLRTAIARIRAALPAVAILVMSPMDRGRRTGVDEIETYDTIPRLVAIQRRVAAETHCAFFDTFDAMGGDGTMARWYAGHPRLVAGDLIHPTPQGASLVAQMLVKDLLIGYDQYVQRARNVPAAEKLRTPQPGHAAERSTPKQPAPARPEPVPDVPPEKNVAPAASEKPPEA